MIFTLIVGLPLAVLAGIWFGMYVTTRASADAFGEALDKIIQQRWFKRDNVTYYVVKEE